MNTRREFPRNVAVGVSGSVRRVVRPVCAPAARRGVAVLENLRSKIVRVLETT